MTLTKNFRTIIAAIIFRFMNRKKWVIPVHVPGKITWYTIYGRLNRWLAENHFCAIHNSFKCEKRASINNNNNNNNSNIASVVIKYY
jgi:hypothetical protein